MITTIIFDLDDTLYDEIDYCRSGFKAVSRRLAKSHKISAEKIFDTLWQQFTAGNRTKTFNAALEKLGIVYDNRVIEELIKVYRSHIPEIKLPADSRSVLEQLSGRYALALLTDGFLPAQRLKVQALGIEKYFKCIIYTEELGREFWKPSPAGFEKIIEALSARPETAVYVADDEQKDFIAPNELGYCTVRIIRRAALHGEPSGRADATAKYTIQGIDLLPNLLSKL